MRRILANRDGGAIKDYNSEQKAACEAWNVELLVDIFPQPEEFETPLYSSSWAYSKPMEFDAKYDKMLEDFEAAGMAEAGEILSSIIKERVELAQ